MRSSATSESAPGATKPPEELRRPATGPPITPAMSTNSNTARRALCGCPANIGARLCRVLSGKLRTNGHLIDTGERARHRAKRFGLGTQQLKAIGSDLGHLCLHRQLDPRDPKGVVALAQCDLGLSLDVVRREAG